MWKVRPEGDTVHKEAPGGRSGLGTRSHPNTLSNFCWFVSFPSFFPFFYRRKTSLGHTGRATADIEKRGEWPCPRVRLSPTPPLCWVESAPAQPGPWGSVCVCVGGVSPLKQTVADRTVLVAHPDPLRTSPQIPASPWSS